MKLKIAMQKVLKNPLGLFGTVVISLVVLIAIFGNLLAPHNPNTPDILSLSQGLSAKHWLGTDSVGRDILSRLILGTRTTLLAALLVCLTATVLGLPAGLIAGYYGKKFDAIASWVANMFMSLPAMIVLLSVRATLGSSMYMSMIVFGILIAPSFFRLTRTAVMGVRNELYVDAARVSGLSDSRIIRRHILTVVRAPLIIQTAIVSGIAISLQSGLEFLGLGDPRMVSWGVVLNDGFRNIYLKPLLILWPALAISITMAALVLLGNAFRDALEDSKKVKSLKKRTENTKLSTKVTQPVGAHLLSVDHIGIGYPQIVGELRAVVHDVSFTLDRGEVLGIVGESGSGKTQTAFSILGLLPSNAEIIDGRITFDGQALLSPEMGKIDNKIMHSLRGKRIAYIPQEPMSNLDPNFTIGHQLTRPLVKVAGLSKEDARAKVMGLLATVGIKDPERVFKSYPHEISGGMAQRILIAGAVSCEPDLLIADEPTTALDVTIQAEVLDLLRKLQGEFEMGILLVTHNFGVVADLCDRVVVMQHGRMVEQGSVREILKNPQEIYTKELLNSMLVDKTPLKYLTQTMGA
jgi:ABC-type dipeptide/oligopeptide/nickel transport system ATPase component/ABC-type dipeptide/oligopeptide/nickel transport system permease subunit